MSAVHQAFVSYKGDKIPDTATIAPFVEDYAANIGSKFSPFTGKPVEPIANESAKVTAEDFAEIISIGKCAKCDSTHRADTASVKAMFDNKCEGFYCIDCGAVVDLDVNMKEFIVAASDASTGAPATSTAAPASPAAAAPNADAPAKVDVVNAEIKAEGDDKDKDKANTAHANGDDDGSDDDADVIDDTADNDAGDGDDNDAGDGDGDASVNNNSDDESDADVIDDSDDGDSDGGDDTPGDADVDNDGGDNDADVKADADAITAALISGEMDVSTVIELIDEGALSDEDVADILAQEEKLPSDVASAIYDFLIDQAGLDLSDIADDDGGDGSDDSDADVIDDTTGGDGSDNNGGDGDGNGDGDGDGDGKSAAPAGGDGTGTGGDGSDADADKTKDVNNDADKSGDSASLFTDKDDNPEGKTIAEIIHHPITGDEGGEGDKANLFTLDAKVDWKLADIGCVLNEKGTAYYVFANGMPVASLLRDRAHEDNAKLFESDVFVKGFGQQIRNGKDVSRFGFTPYTVAVDTAAIRKGIESKQLADTAAQLSSDYDKQVTVLKDSIVVATVAANKGMWNAYSNPVKDKLIEKFTARGIEDAASIIDRIFADNAQAATESVLAKALEISSKPEQVRKEIKDMVDSAKYAVTVQTAPLADKLSRMGVLETVQEDTSRKLDAPRAPSKTDKANSNRDYWSKAF